METKYQLIQVLNDYLGMLATAMDASKTDGEREELRMKMAGLKTLIGVVEQQEEIPLYDTTTQVALLWSVRDVQSLRFGLTTVQAMSVLNAVVNHQNSDYGVTWDTLESELDEMYPLKDVEDDILRLVGYMNKGIKLERAINSGAGVQVRCLSDNEILFQTTDPRHQRHVGHAIIITTSGEWEKTARASIECGDCGKVIYSLERTADGSITRKV